MNAIIKRNFSVHARLVFLVIGIIHWLLVVPMEKKFFLIPLGSNIYFFLFKIITILGFWQIVASIVEGYRKNTGFRKPVIYSTTYFVFSILLLLLIWPGNWIWDELEVLLMLRTLRFEAWQHFLTSTYYYIALFLFPSSVFVVIFQLFCISVIVGFTVNLVSKLSGNSKWTLLSYVPFLFPSVLVNNYCPYRSTIFSYLILFFLAYVVYLRWRNVQLSVFNLIVLLLVAGLIATWRGEGAVFLVLVPVLMIAAFWRLSSRHQKSGFIALFFVLVASIHVLQGMTWDPIARKTYPLTLYITPLANLLQQAKHNGRDDLVSAVDEIIVVDTLQKHQKSLAAFWEGKIFRAPYFNDQGSSRLFILYLDLIKTYPRQFIEERWRFFRQDRLMVPISAHSIFLGKVDEAASPIFQDEPFSTFINFSLREEVLSMAMPFFGTRLGYAIYDPIIPMGILLLLVFFFLTKRQFTNALIVSAGGAPSLLVILSAPDYYSMYYFSAFLSGYVAFFAVLIIGCVSRWNQKASVDNK